MRRMDHEHALSQASAMGNTDDARLANQWPVPHAQADKYSRGVVGIDTGSPRYPGAAVLSVLGAAYSGAGFIRFIGTDVVRESLLTLVPSVTFGPGRVDVWLAGCGWDDDGENAARLQARLADGVPVVIDAGALWMMPEPLPPGCVLTPHAGELARLLNLARQDIAADPERHALHAARRWEATVLLKGHRQVIASPDGDVTWAMPGPAWSAQAGSGDALAGVLASVIAQGRQGPQAAWLAASIQALAAARHPGPYPVHEAVRFLPEVIGSLGK